MDSVRSTVMQAGSCGARGNRETNLFVPKKIVLIARGNIWKLPIVLLVFVLPAISQNQDTETTTEKPSAVSKGIDYLFNYLNMAGTNTAANFHPMTQTERNQLYLKTL